MNKKLLTIAITFGVLAIIVAVAAERPADLPSEGIVSDISTALNNILTSIQNIVGKIDNLQTIVDSNFTDVDDALEALDVKITSSQTPAEPTSYEYYTSVLFDANNRDIGLLSYERLTNWGDSAADACYYKYLKNGSQPWELSTHTCITLQPGQTRDCTPTWVLGYWYEYKVKFTTTSKYVVPYARFGYTDGEEIITFLPGDFHKVEIYS